VVNRWKVLDQRTVDAPSLNAFKNDFFRIRDNRMWAFSWTRSAKPWPCWGVVSTGVTGRPRKVNHKVHHYLFFKPEVYTLYFSKQKYK